MTKAKARTITDTWPQWLVRKVKLSRYTPNPRELNALGKGVYQGEEVLTSSDIELLDGLSRQTAIHPLTVKEKE